MTPRKLAPDSQVKIEANERVEVYRKRREYLLFTVPRCPKCLQAGQVRLEEYIFVRPATWRCLGCNHGFSHEPVLTEE